MVSRRYQVRTYTCPPAHTTHIGTHRRSPAASFGSWNPGVKTGSFRLGTDVLITDVNGNSEISGGDYATAFVDEIDKPVSAAW